MAVVANAGGAWHIFVLCGSIWSLGVCVSIIWSSFTCEKKYNSLLYLGLTGFSAVLWFLELLAIGLDFPTDCSGILACRVIYASAGVGFVVWTLFSFLAYRICKKLADALDASRLQAVVR